MRRFWAKITFFFRAQKCWHWPRQSQILLFDAAHQEILLEYIQSWTPEILHLRGEHINMRVLWASLFREGKWSEAYIDCFIEKVHPHLIVTCVDNDFRFYSLAARHQNIKTLFIQNGIRGYNADIFEKLHRIDPATNRLKVDHMMTFGSRIGAEYARYIQGTVVPMGSFRNNLVPKRTSKKAGTIAFISQYRYTQGFFMGSNFYSFWEFFEQADRLVLPLLEKYAKEKDKTLIIVPCSSHHKDDTLLKEKEYYNRLLGQTCAFSDWGWHGSSYETADSAEVVVAIDSSMGLESAARGTKAAIFSIRSQLLGLLDPPFLSYGWPGNYPDEGPFWTNQPEPAIFERILDHLFAISDEQWKAELDKHHFSDLMAYDPGNTILQSVLRHELGAPPQMDQKQ